MQPSSNIYVSVQPGHTPTADRDEDGYRRAQHTWLISVAPHKHYIPLLPRHKAEPVHFTAEASEGSDAYHVVTRPTSGIIGTILLNEGAHGSADDIRQMLEDGLRSSGPNVPSEQTRDGAADRWIEKGIHVLQDRKVLDTFDVGEFMTFAHAYVAGRVDREGPSMVVYPKVNKNLSDMSQKHGLWLSYPTREAVREGRRSDNDEDGDTGRKYGGLM